MSTSVTEPELRKWACPECGDSTFMLGGSQNQAGKLEWLVICRSRGHVIRPNPDLLLMVSIVGEVR